MLSAGNEPEIAAIFDSLNDIYYSSDEQQAIDAKFPECRHISVDYAIMEHASTPFYVFPQLSDGSESGNLGVFVRTITERRWKKCGCRRQGVGGE